MNILCQGLLLFDALVLFATLAKPEQYPEQLAWFLQFAPRGLWNIAISTCNVTLTSKVTAN